MKRVWTGCGHSHRRAASVLHGASGSAVWRWTRWWGLPGVWGNAGPGRGHAGDTLLKLIIFIIILCNQTSPLLPPSFLHRTSFQYKTSFSCRFLSGRLPSSLHHIFLLYTKSHIWCGKFAFVTCVCLCLHLPSVSQDCSAALSQCCD